MRTFNTTAVCIPSKHYMVDLTSRLEQIKTMIDAGQYFVVNRARQYGKTTLFAALYRFLKDEYTVVSLDFQALSGASFETEGAFISSFSRILHRRTGDSLPETIQVRLRKLMEKERPVLDEFSPSSPTGAGSRTSPSSS